MLILKSLEKKKKNKKVTKTKYYLKRRATLALKKQYRLCKELFLCESITLLSSLKKIIGYFSGNEKYSGSHYGKSLQFLTAPSKNIKLNQNRILKTIITTVSHGAHMVL